MRSSAGLGCPFERLVIRLTTLVIWNEYLQHAIPFLMTFSFCITARFLTQLYLVQTLAGKRVAAYEPRHTFAKTALPRFLTKNF